MHGRANGLLAPPELDSRQRLLLSLCRREVAREVATDLLGTLNDAPFREAFVTLARRHRVLGLVLVSLEREAGQFPMPEAARALLAHLPRLRREAALRDLERDRILALCERRGLVPVVLKGAALRRTVYEEPAERLVGDLDILFQPDEVDDAIRCLLSMGYRLPSVAVTRAYRDHHFHIRLAHGNGFLAEVHWALTEPQSPFRLDTAALLRRARLERSRPLFAMRVPSSEDMLLHLASQNMEEGFSHLCRLVDLDRIIRAEPRLNWSYVAQSAHAGGLETVLALSLSLARALLGSDVPSDALARLRLPRPNRVHLELYHPASALLHQHARAVASAQSYLRLWSMSGWRHRGSFLRRMLAGNEEPLRWVWAGCESADQLPARPFAAAAVLKLLGYHLWLYVRGSALLLVSPLRSAWLRVE